MKREITATIFIEASPAQVWRAVESQEMIRKWLGGAVEFEPRLGGRVRIYGQDDQGTRYVMGGEVVTWAPGEKLQFTWEGFEPEPSPQTVLTLELVPEETGTRVTLRHDGFSTEEEYLSYKEGWGDMGRSVEKIAAIATAAA